MKRAAGYIIAIVVLATLVFGLGDLSTRTATCMWCHTREARFAKWMHTRLVKDKKGFSHELIACAACHIEGAARNSVMSKFRGLQHAAMYLVRQVDPRRPLISGLYKNPKIPSDNCLYCHKGAVRRRKVMVRDLPGELKKIGLAMDHRKHVLTSEKTCARCHERYKKKDDGVADKNVNYAEINHLSCDACHTSASHAYRTGTLAPLTAKAYEKARDKAWRSLSKAPRWMVAFPSEEACRRCHNGRIHFKTRIFLADCRNGTNFDNCKKCHPMMTKRYFEELRAKRKGTTATIRKTDPGLAGSDPGYRGG